MTFNATLTKLIRNGTLEHFPLPEWERRYKIRSLYVATDFWLWVDGDDGLHVAKAVLGRRSVYEQIELMLSDFLCADRPPGGSELRRMIPHPQGVYRLQPAGSRVYGWIPEPNCFVVVSADTEHAFKTTPGLYEQHRKGVIAFRQNHGVDNGYLTGDYRALFTR